MTRFTNIWQSKSVVYECNTIHLDGNDEVQMSHNQIYECAMFIQHSLRFV